MGFYWGYLDPFTGRKTFPVWRGSQKRGNRRGRSRFNYNR